MKSKQLFLFLSIMVCCITYPVAAKEFLIGADISALTVLEKTGAVYCQNDKPEDLIAILKDNGFNTIRLRLFVNPNKKGAVTNDLSYTLDLAKRAKAHGMKLLLNLQDINPRLNKSHLINHLKLTSR